MANYLVTGAGGFIGSSVAKRLVEDGNFVVTIDNFSTGFEYNVPDQVMLIEGDCADPKAYKKIPQIKYDAILHIAGQSSGEISFENPIYDIKTNTESTLLLLKFALSNNCRRFIYAGTMSVYGVQPDYPVLESVNCRPESFYGVGKLASEHYMRIYESYGINWTSLRLFNVYGPGQNLQNNKQGMVSIFLAQALEEGKIHVKGRKDRFRDFIYIDDVVEAFVRCVNESRSFNQSINIGTGRKVTVKELINFLVSNFDHDIPVFFEGGTPGDIHGIWANTKKMDDLLGKWAKTSLKDGIQNFLAKI